jgi:hypothetical protein
LVLSTVALRFYPSRSFYLRTGYDAIHAAKIAIAKPSKKADDAGKPRIIKLTEVCDLMCTAYYPIHDCDIWHSIQRTDVFGHLNDGRYTDRRTKAGKVPRNSHDDVEDNFVRTYVLVIYLGT